MVVASMPPVITWQDSKLLLLLLPLLLCHGTG
jgi:hypothetical protein